MVLTREESDANPRVVAKFRDSALDAGRGILMLLGVVLHTSNIYAENDNWLLSDDTSSPFFDLLGSAIHSFRMPAFFLISGYFCAMALAKQPLRAYLEDRMLRLGIPLLVVWLLINPFQYWALHDSWWPLRGGGILPLYHLWFLVDLLVLTPLVPIFHRVVRAAMVRIESQASLTWWESVLLLALGTMAVSLLVRATRVAYVPIFGLTSLYRLSMAAPFFVFGMLLFGMPRLKKSFLDTPFWMAAPALVVSLTLASVPSQGRLMAELLLLSSWVATAVLTAVVIRACYLLFPKTSSFTQVVAESSYSVYLLHHVLVILFGLAILDEAVWVGAKFLFVTAATSVTSIALHYVLISRFRLTRMLLNGKA